MVEFDEAVVLAWLGMVLGLTAAQLGGGAGVGRRGRVRHVGACASTNHRHPVLTRAWRLWILILNDH
jgi:hypothetical protein